MIKKKISQLLGYNLRTYIKKFRKFNAKHQLDLKMLDFINYDNGFFIEIGAHDGVNGSNTFFYEKYKQWNGLLIEPSNFYKNLIKNRSKKNFFFNCGCGAFNDERTSYLSGYGDFSVFKELNSNEANKAWEKEWFEWYDERKSKKIKLEKIKVQIRTLNSLLNEINAPLLIDFFSLDVEGMELQVLKGIDFNKYKFKYILVEILSNFEEKNKYLESKNYILLKKLGPFDYLFKNY